ncbi:MAG TPA: SLBB domain-containing protein [Longimicrobiales bacterium]|nr:SLBB domain-containing protein [Longimicrobiales bacterium]
MFRRSIFIVAFVLAFPVAVVAQNVDAGRIQVSRDSLVKLLAQLDSTAGSRGYSDALRERARREAELLRNRLQQGDFQTGDRIFLQVEGQQELTDTFTVSPGLALILPAIREVPLAGLLRGELTGHLEQHLKRFLVNPVVQATPLMRIWLDGGVNQPGVYLIPAHALVTDAIMAAGGTTSDARVTAIRIERGNKRIWEGEALQRAITEGRTLDELSMRAGDRIIVEEGRGGMGGLMNTLMAVVPVLVLVLTQIF